MIKDMMFPASDVEMTDICCSCNCVRGHCMEDDTKSTRYTKPQRKKKLKEKSEKRREDDGGVGDGDDALRMG